MKLNGIFFSAVKLFTTCVLLTDACDAETNIICKLSYSARPDFKPRYVEITFAKGSELKAAGLNSFSLYAVIWYAKDRYEAFEISTPAALMGLEVTRANFKSAFLFASSLDGTSTADPQKTIRLTVKEGMSEWVDPRLRNDDD